MLQPRHEPQNSSVIRARGLSTGRKYRERQLSPQSVSLGLLQLISTFFTSYDDSNQTMYREDTLEHRGPGKGVVDLACALTTLRKSISAKWQFAQAEYSSTVFSGPPMGGSRNWAGCQDTGVPTPDISQVRTWEILQAYTQYCKELIRDKWFVLNTHS